VASFLEAQGVAKTRLIEKWYGETQPKYANDNEENRKKNRRVELAIYADEKMKEDAKDGKLK
jgi:outer membrane protein OmpA-like peptidoglycan-associated protein